MDDSPERPACSNDVTHDRLAVLEDQQAQLAETLRALTATVKRLAEAVSSRSTTRATGSPTAQPVSAVEMVAWVSWLVERYELDIPACWPRHGAIVEEFDALRIGWQDTIGKGQGGLAAMQWHDGLARLIERIENVWGRRCMDGEHHPRDPAEWLATGPDGAEDLDVVAGRYSPPTDPGTSQM